MGLQWYPYVIPLQLLVGVVYATNKSLSLQTRHIASQILSEYVIHFGILWYLVNKTKNGIIAMEACLWVTYAAMLLCTSSVMFSAIWKNQAKK